MLSVEEATRRVAATVRPLPTRISGAAYWWRVAFCAKIYSPDRDFPPFNRGGNGWRSASFSALEAGQLEFQIAHTQFAANRQLPCLIRGQPWKL